MSRNKDKKTPSLNQQVRLKLQSKLKQGLSKHQLKLKYSDEYYEKNIKSETGETKQQYINRKFENIIFSQETYNTYYKKSMIFMDWCVKKYSIKNCRTIQKNREYVSEYLQDCINRGLSAWTIRCYASSLAKLYDCGMNDFNVELPTRHRADITRSNHNYNDKVSYENNKELIEFCKSTGLRRHEIKALKGTDLVTDINGEVKILVRNGKGGKSRNVQIIGEYREKILQMMKQAGDKKVFTKILTTIDIHSYRRQYAMKLYKMYEKNIQELERKEKYYCRKDKKGITYDKQAMLIVSKNLGHNRIDVIALSYLTADKN